MPKGEAMSQVSRPTQIALGAVLLFGLVWMVALRGHTANPSEPAPTSAPASAPVSHPLKSASVTKSSAQTVTAREHRAGSVSDPKHPASGTTTHKTSSSGVHTSSRTHVSHIVTASGAHGTVVVHRTVTVSPDRAVKAKPVQVKAKPVHAQAVPRPKSHAHGGSGTGRQPQQVTVERELAQGKTVILVVWNPNSTVDVTVNAQVNVLARGSKGTIVVHDALANEVDAYGPVTEAAQVYQTPTVLIVNSHGVVSTLTGLTDLFALEQAVREAKTASA
jgi:hypothetical protein